MNRIKYAAVGTGGRMPMSIDPTVDDVLNWWIDGIPSLVFALGDLVYYGKKIAVNRGEGGRTGYPRYTGMSEAENAPFRRVKDSEPQFLETPGGSNMVSNTRRTLLRGAGISCGKAETIPIN